MQALHHSQIICLKASIARKAVPTLKKEEPEMYQEQPLKMAIPILGGAILILGGVVVVAAVGVAVEAEEAAGADGVEVKAMVTTLKS